MKTLLTVFLSVIIFSISSAQSIFSPLTTNSAVEEAFSKKWNGQNVTSQPIMHFMVSNCDDLDKELYVSGSEVYVVSGTTKTFCIDRFVFDALEKISCLNCDDLISGTVGPLDQEDFCITYSANAGIITDHSDTLTVELDVLGGTKILEFPILIRRANQSTQMNQVIVEPDSFVNICIPNIDLPGEEISYTNLSCNDLTLGNIGALNDTCFNYFSQRFGTQDTLCIEVCDENCICDTYQIPLEILAPPSIVPPFFDDFSNEGPYPNPTLWLDDRIWVNNTLGVDPPSIGVATFDGMNERGTPYGPQFGQADFLTSTYIDLSGNNAGQDVNLSFFLSPKGKGYPPRMEDSITLEFKNNAEEWIQVEKWDGPSSNPGLLEQIGFDFYSVPLDDQSWFHDNFQFRFINHCKGTGIQYTWHLDYVRLENKFVDNPPSHPDVAFTLPPSSLLNDYEHIPFKQFEAIAASIFRGSMEFELFNHFPVERSITNFNTLTISDKENQITFFQDPTFIDPVLIDKPAFDPIARFSSSLSFDLGQVIPDQIDFSADRLVLETEYDFDVNEEFGNTFPATKANNTVRRTHYLDDFYGFDDGTAEITIRMENNGASRIAHEIELYTPDSLKGIQIYFPHFGQSSGGEFTIKVIKDDINNAPIFESNTLEVIFPDALKPSIAGFTQYRFVDENGLPDPVGLDGGIYYIVLDKGEDPDVLFVGFDLNNTEYQDKQWFFNTSSSSWNQQFLPGAYLMRSVFGSGIAPATRTDNPSASLSFEVFPNPANESLYIKTISGEFDFHIYDLFGRVLQQGKLAQIIPVEGLSNGVYYLQVTDNSNGMSGVQKIEILH